MIVAQHVFRIVLIAVIPWTGGAVQGIAFCAGSMAACYFREGLRAFFRPGGDPVFREIGEIYVGSEIVSLKGKFYTACIRRTFYPGFFHGIFQLLDSAFDRIGAVANPVGNLWIPCVVCALGRLHNVRPVSGTFLHHQCKYQIHIAGHAISGGGLLYLRPVGFAGRVDSRLLLRGTACAKHCRGEQNECKKTYGKERQKQFLAEYLLFPEKTSVFFCKFCLFYLLYLHKAIVHRTGCFEKERFS